MAEIAKKDGVWMIKYYDPSTANELTLKTELSIKQEVADAYSVLADNVRQVLFDEAGVGSNIRVKSKENSKGSFLTIASEVYQKGQKVKISMEDIEIGITEPDWYIQAEEKAVKAKSNKERDGILDSIEWSKEKDALVRAWWVLIELITQHWSEIVLGEDTKQLKLPFDKEEA